MINIKVVAMVVAALALFESSALAQTKPEPPLAYQFYNAKGKPATWQEVVKASAGADVVCFGELHNQSMVHWLQLRLAQSLHQAKEVKLSLAYEMFEADVQPAFDSLTTAIATENWEISDKQLKRLRLWPNYATDYKPLVDWASKQKLRQVASNCPRPLARLVSKHGLDTLRRLSAREQAWLCPLPLAVDTTLPGYKAMAKMMGGHGMPGFNPWNLVYAQATKDATMAYRTLLLTAPGGTTLHLNGSYHRDNFEGLVHYLPIMAKAMNKPAPKVITISTV